MAHDLASQGLERGDVGEAHDPGALLGRNLKPRDGAARVVGCRGAQLCELGAPLRLGGELRELV